MNASQEYHRWQEEKDIWFGWQRMETEIANIRERERAERRRQTATFVLMVGLPIIIALAVAAILS